MNIAEKSTELGGGADLAQAVLDSTTIKKHTHPDTGFDCFKIKGEIPADGNQRGSTHNNYYYHSSRLTWTTADDVDTDAKADAQALSDALDENSTKEAVEAAYLAWLNLQDYNEKPLVVAETEAFPS